jgi:redox-sensitive bicupin YhaK (pirin superfamily)
MSSTTQRSYLVMRPEDHVVLGPSDFGGPGLVAVESIGPFNDIQAVGPLITVHDSVIDAGLGIGHHPHRFNERLFYIEEGELDHDDSLNGIQGHMDSGDVGQFVEGQRGMWHSEWNNGGVDTRAYILVYGTEPIPSRTEFNALRDADAPRYQESPGVRTKEMVGPRSPLVVHGDVRLFTDSNLDPDAKLEVSLEEIEGGLVSVRQGSVRIGDEEMEPGTTVVFPPEVFPRAATIVALERSRLIRVVCGMGHGLVRGEPLARRS